MCGVAGVAGGQITAETLKRVERMVASLRHRGPDNGGTKALNGAVLGHARLSIIDLSERGRQPLHDGTGRVHVTFNGEIYNYRALRMELEPTRRFLTETDTEVLVHGFLEWGLAGLLSRIRGMFAFGLWDGDQGVLHLARDHFGIKPLLYAIEPDRLVFASEAKALHSFFERVPPPSPTGLVLGLHNHGIPAPWSAFDGYRQLEPGTCLSFTPSSRRLQQQRYWRWTPTPIEIGPEAAEREVWSAVVQSVEQHLIADVPVGLLLSGGLDSTLIGAACAELGRRPECFTLCFTEDPARSEAEPAAAVCRRFGFPHRIITIESREAHEAERLLPTIYDEPYGSSAALNAILLSREVSRHLKVVLGGDGGDELFFGYAWHQRWPALYGPRGQRRRPWRRLLNRARAAVRLAHWSSDPLAGYSNLVGTLPPGVVGQLFHRDVLARCESDPDGLSLYRSHDRPALDWRDRLQALDLEVFLPNACLTKLDRASMAHGLEVRVPLLDVVMATLAGRLPPEVRSPQGEPKALLRRIARMRLPAEVWDRPKQGFGAPVASWFDHRSMLGELADDLTQDWCREWFSAKALQVVQRLSPPRIWRVLQTWRWLRAHARQGWESSLVKS